MHIVTKDEPDPTAAEKLAIEICELQIDLEELRYRLDGRRPSPESVREERARRWERVLALVQAAVDAAAKVPQQPVGAIAIAARRGWDAQRVGAPRKALPPEYRTEARADEADAWITAWERSAKFQRDRGA
jgi:hypothetical protein